MKSTVSYAKYCVSAAASGACAVAIALCPPEQEVLKMVSATRGTAYLDCAVVQRDRVLEPDLLPPCSMLA